MDKSSLNGPYKNLATAIVRQTIVDMQQDLRKGRFKNGVERAYYNFFTSDYFKLLMDSDGEVIYRQLIRNYGRYERCTFIDLEKEEKKNGRQIEKGRCESSEAL